MRKTGGKTWLAALIITVAMIAVLFQSVFVVDETRPVVLTQFGRPLGEAITRPGPHVRIPWIQQIHHLRLPPAAPSFENSLFLAPLYVQYLSDSEDKFHSEAVDLKNRIGTGRYITLGFAVFLDISFPAVNLSEPLAPEQMSGSLQKIDAILQRARDNGLAAHISLISGFFHGWNDLREHAIREDVRNAQWFADGLIAPETDLKDPATVPHSIWLTPSRYALPLRSRIEEGVRMIGARLAHGMAESPETLVTIAGDGEVEFTYERNFLGAGERISDRQAVIYTDYSPFMVAEFRDWLRRDYRGDLSPASDENGDGRTFDRDFNQSFNTWRLRYYDESGPVPYDAYLQRTEKLPASGRFFIEGGFDAPRKEKSDDRFWKAWLDFRKHVIANWVRDFATWITSSPDPATGFRIPPSRYYSYQIPANFIFGESDSLRLKTSASYLETTFIEPVGSPGITAFNGYDGRKHFKTATPNLFSAMYLAGDHWAILEYNPSIPYDNAIPPSGDEEYYLRELHQLYAFRPHVLVPFAWSDLAEHKRYSIKDSAFERALRRFVQEAGATPWFSWRQVLAGS